MLEQLADGRVRLEATAISGSYQGRTVDGEPRTTIELWCRCRDGPSLLLLVDGLRPFLEVAVLGRASPRETVDAELLEARLARLCAHEHVVSVGEPELKWTDLGMKRHWRVEVTQPYTVPALRETLAREWEVSSADILFVNRLFLDRDLGTHLAADVELLALGPRVPEALAAALAEGTGVGRDVDEEAMVDRIRAAGGAGRYPVDLIARCDVDDIRDAEPFPTPWVVLSFDLETSVRGTEILCAAVVIERPGGREEHTLAGDEATLLADLARLVRETDPDVITGYNVDNFDLPRVAMRKDDLVTGRGEAADAEAVRLFGWGRVPPGDGPRRSVPTRTTGRQWRMPGRVVMDAWWQVRTTLAPRQESLSYVTQLLWPDREDLHKLPIDASRMDEEWAERPDEVLAYCLRDAHLPLDLLAHMRSVSQREALASVARATLEVAVSGTTSQWIDSLVIRLADRQGVAVPRTRQGQRGEQIAGGYVHDVEPGIHPWIAVLDFKSMYPSIMIAHNICHTTRLDAGDPRAELGGVHEAPTGVRFLPSEVRSGLVPQLLEQLMARRDALKQARDAARTADDAAGEAFNERLQQAVKILMNSFYGVFASSFYRFTHQDIGASITAWARANIKGVISELEAEDIGVVYSDTDSIFVRAAIGEDAPRRAPPDNASPADHAAFQAAIEELRGFGEALASRFSVAGAELEFEQGLSVFFSHGAKKRYVGRVVWPTQHLLVRGYEPRRTDAFELLQRALMRLFDRILDGEVREGVEEVVALIRTIRAGEADIAELVTSRSCKGRLRPDGSVDFTQDYQNPDGLLWVRAAKLRLKRGLSFTPGMKVSWIVTDATRQPMTVEPWLREEIGAEVSRYDPTFYAERLATALGRLTEAFGWTAKDLLAGHRQMSLFSFG